MTVPTDNLSTPNGAANTADSALENVGQEVPKVASTVKEQGSATAAAVQQGGQVIANEAKEQLTQLTEQAQRQLHEVLERAQYEFNERASEQTGKAAQNLRGLADELQALAEGRTQDAPRAVDYVGQAAQRASYYAERLDTGGFAGAAEDLSRFARRRPGLFLLGAVVAGVAAGRFARGAQKGADGGLKPRPNQYPSVTAGQGAPALSTPSSSVPSDPEGRANALTSEPDLPGPLPI
jgi:hypothetical protein